MNTLAYIIYLFITYLVTVHVGFIFYRNGRIYILRLLEGDEKLTDFLNRILLTGYYLLNLGYAALMIHNWKTIVTWVDLVTSVGFVTGKIMTLLALIHYLNMAAILLISHFHNRDHSEILNNKNLGS